MRLQQMHRALRAELRTQASTRRFEAAKHHQPELQHHACVFDVLDTLGNDSAQHYAAKEALTRALLREQAHHPNPFWDAVLVVAFYPMLARLRCRIYGDAVQSDDLDQIILIAFVDITRRFPLQKLCDRTCMHLRQMTQRQVFKLLRKEQREFNNVRYDPPRGMRFLQEERQDLGYTVNWPETKSGTHEAQDLDACADQVAFLKRHAEQVLGEDRMALVIATLVYGERLPSYVARHHPGLSPKQRQKAYQRIKRRHSRALSTLREQLVDLPLCESQGEMSHG